MYWSPNYFAVVFNNKHSSHHDAGFSVWVFKKFPGVIPPDPHRGWGWPPSAPNTKRPGVGTQTLVPLNFSAVVAPLARDRTTFSSHKLSGDCAAVCRVQSFLDSAKSGSRTRATRQWCSKTSSSATRTSRARSAGRSRASYISASARSRSGSRTAAWSARNWTKEPRSCSKTRTIRRRRLHPARAVAACRSVTPRRPVRFRQRPLRRSSIFRLRIIITIINNNNICSASAPDMAGFIRRTVTDRVAECATVMWWSPADIDVNAERGPRLGRADSTTRLRRLKALRMTTSRTNTPMTSQSEKGDCSRGPLGPRGSQCPVTS